MYHPKDKFDTVRRNPYFINNYICNYIILNLFLYSTVASDASAPINVTASPLSGKVGIRVSWTAPNLLTGLPITGYLIQYKIRGSQDDKYMSVVTGTNQDITDLQSNTQYRIRVATITSLGTGPYCCDNPNGVFVTTSK